MIHSSCGLSADLYFFGIKFQCFALESYCRLLPLISYLTRLFTIECECKRKAGFFDLRVQERVRATSQI